MQKRVVRVLLEIAVVVTVLLISGCQPIEDSANDLLASHTGFIDQAEKNHPECLVQGDANPICRAIKVSGLARNFLIDSVHIYCSGPPLPGNKPYGPDPVTQGGPCSSQKGLESRLRAAMRDFDRNYRDLYALTGGKP